MYEPGELFSLKPTYLTIFLRTTILLELEKGDNVAVTVMNFFFFNMLFILCEYTVAVFNTPKENIESHYRWL